LRLRPGLCPILHWGSLQCSPRFQLYLRDPLCTREERAVCQSEQDRRKEEGRGGEGRKRMERQGKRWKGKGGGRLCHLSQEFLQAPMLTAATSKL